MTVGSIFREEPMLPNTTSPKLSPHGRADVSFIPYATRDFTPRLTFEQNWFRYDHSSELDFDSQSLQLEARYNLTRDPSWFVDGSYALTRLYSQHPSIGEFYKFGFLNR